MTKLYICPAKDWRNYKIAYWYDVSLRLWTIQVLNRDNFQVGEALYETNRANAEKTVYDLSVSENIAA